MIVVKKQRLVPLECRASRPRTQNPKRIPHLNVRILLAHFPNAVRADMLEGTWSPPVSDGSGRERSTLKRALDLFASAGFDLRGSALVDRRSGQPFTFEIMVTDRDQERLALLFSQISSGPAFRLVCA